MACASTSLLADKGYDSQAVRAIGTGHGARQLEGHIEESDGLGDVADVAAGGTTWSESRRRRSDGACLRGVPG